MYSKLLTADSVCVYLAEDCHLVSLFVNTQATNIICVKADMQWFFTKLMKK